MLQTRALYVLHGKGKKSQLHQRMNPRVMLASFIITAGAFPCCLVLLQITLLLVSQPSLWVTGSAAAGGSVLLAATGILLFVMITSGVQDVAVIPGKTWKIYLLLLMMLLIALEVLVLLKFSPDTTLSRSSLMIGSLSCAYIILMIITDCVNRKQKVVMQQTIPDGAQYVFART